MSDQNDFSNDDEITYKQIHDRLAPLRTLMDQVLKDVEGRPKAEVKSLVSLIEQLEPVRRDKLPMSNQTEEERVSDWTQPGNDQQAISIESESPPKTKRKAEEEHFLIKEQHRPQLIFQYVLATLVSGLMGTIVVVVLAETYAPLFYVLLSLVGGTVGVAQCLVSRNPFEWNHWGEWTIWITFTSWGTLIGAFTFLFFSTWNPFDLKVPAVVIGSVVGTTGGFSVGGLQWLFFHRQVKTASWWIVTTAIAGGVGGALAGVMSDAMSPADMTDRLVTGVLSAVILGLVVGGAQACQLCFFRKK
jgi:hypothetical protein